MPLYEYDCLECGERFEALVLASDDRPACPACGAERLERAWSTFSSRSAAPSPGATRPCGAPASAPT